MSQGVFTEFLHNHPEEREDFLNALDEAELFDFCSSQEEFSVLLKRDPKREMRKMPEHQADVKMDENERESLREAIQERFDKFMAAFPQSKTMDALKDHVREKTQPSMNVSITLNMMREMSGQEKPKDA